MQFVRSKDNRSAPKVLTDAEVKIIQGCSHFCRIWWCQRSSCLVQRGLHIFSLLGIPRYKNCRHLNSRSHIQNKHKRRRNYLIVILLWYFYGEADRDDRTSLRSLCRRRAEAHYCVTPALLPVPPPAQNRGLKHLKQPIACH